MDHKATKASTRERILEAATALFLAQSVERTSIADICKRAGVSNGSLFHHFHNKDDIAVEVSLALGAEYWNVVLEALESTSDLNEGVDRAIRASFAYQRSHYDRYRFLLTDETPWMKGAMERIRVANAPFRERAGRWIGAQLKAGKIAALQPEAYGAMLFGAAHWAGRVAPMGPSPKMDAIADDLVRIVQKALAPEPK